MYRLTIPFLLLMPLTLAHAAPQQIRGSDTWAIYHTASADDWQSLLTAQSLAAGKPVDLRPQPSYAPPSDPDDPKQLTDGQLAASPTNIISDKRAVGWSYTPYVRLTIDLGQIQPIGQILLRVQVLSKDNTLPGQITLSLSDTGDYFTPVRRISEKVHPDDNPAITFEPLAADQPGVYAVALQAGYQARYVRLDLATHGHFVTDELAVLPGPANLQKLPPAPQGRREWEDNVFDRRDQFAKLIAPGNLSAGLTLRYAPQPGYRLTTDEADPTNLTDGQFGERTDEKIWFEKRAVCWQFSPLVTIFADLGQVQPVGSVVARFLGGGEQGGLTFPDELRVLLSADGKEYYQVTTRHKRGLDDLSADAYDLPEEKLAWVHNFALPVGYRARYVALQAVHQKQFICSDEIAIVKGAGNLPDFSPAAGKRVSIVTSGVAFEPVWGDTLPVATMPLRTKLAITDARTGKAYMGPCTLVIDLPETLKLAAPALQPSTVDHNGRAFQRYRIDTNRHRLEFYFQSLLPHGKTDTLYTYGDSGQGLENERQVKWQSFVIPAARVPKRLHVSLAWSGAEGLADDWPDYFGAMKHLGFNAIATFPRYWKESDVPRHQATLQAGRDLGFKVIVNESPAGALEGFRNQPETKSQLPDGPGTHVCPSYRGQYYQAEHQAMAQHAVWARPDYIFYDIEAYWSGAIQDAQRCSRCVTRYKEGNYKDWDAFREAMGLEIHQSLRSAVDQALAQSGLKQSITYGSYRTEPITRLNDGLFSFLKLYPDLLQVGMPSLYVAGNAQAVATSISRNRALLDRNDIIPWLSTGTYGEYEPSHTRDMILEAFANGARGITYYCYGDFDPAHFMYHAQAVDLVAPIEDIFMDGKPLTGLKSSNDKVKVCGMGMDAEMAVLVSNYANLPPDTTVKVSIPVAAKTAVYDVDSGQKIAELTPGKPLELRLGDRSTTLLYLGAKYAKSVARD